MHGERRRPHPARRTARVVMAGCVIAGCAVAQPQAEPGAKTVLACIGDSITAGARSSDRAKKSYPAQLQRLLGDRYEVVDLGVGSCTLIRKGRPNVWTTRKRKNVGFIDLNTPLADKPGLFHKGDGVHLNDAGYRALARLVHEGLDLTPSAP